MSRTVLGLVLVVVFFATSPAFAAEPLVVDVWPGKVPGDIGIKGQETSRIHQSPLVGPTKLITNVTKPTLTIYQPPKDKNTGTAMIICPGGGYWDLYWELEGEEVAAWLNSVGMTGIILKYRCPRRPGEDQDRARPGPAARCPAGRQPRAQPRPRNGASTPSESAWSASRPAVISHWRPRPISPNGCMSRSTRSTKSVAGPISPSCAIRAI